MDGGLTESVVKSGIDYKRFVCRGECCSTERKIGALGRKERRKEKRGNRKFVGVLSSNRGAGPRYRVSLSNGREGRACEDDTSMLVDLMDTWKFLVQFLQ